MNTYINKLSLHFKCFFLLIIMLLNDINHCASLSWSYMRRLKQKLLIRSESQASSPMKMNFIVTTCKITSWVQRIGRAKLRKFTVQNPLGLFSPHRHNVPCIHSTAWNFDSRLHPEYIAITIVGASPSLLHCQWYVCKRAAKHITLKDNTI